MGDLTGDGVLAEVKSQWNSLWRERFDDKVRAEGIANADYPLLFVDRGTILFATRRFKPPDLRDILEKNKIGDAHRIIQPSPAVGGWGKFIRTVVTSQISQRRMRRAAEYSGPQKQRQQMKKGGRGWLHR